MQKIFDTHFHIIDPKFPLEENQGFVPEYYTAKDYLKELKEMSIEVIGGAIVSGSFQGYHQAYFAEAISELGNQFVGITQLPFDIVDEDIFKFNNIGIKGFDSTYTEVYLHPQGKLESYQREFIDYVDGRQSFMLIYKHLIRN